MKPLAFGATLLGIGLLACGISVQLVYAQVERPDMRCVWRMEEPTCASGGNAMCSAWAGDEGNDCVAGPNFPICIFCDDSSTGAPENTCVGWEGYTCTDNEFSTSCNTNAIRKKGHCLTSGSCICGGLVDFGNCSSYPIWGCDL